MNPSTEVRLKIQAGQKHYPLSLVERLLAEVDGLRVTNAELRKAARVEIIGGHVIRTEEGETLYCEPVPVIVVRS